MTLLNAVRPRVVNLYSLIYPLTNFNSRIYLQIFFIFSLLQMSIVKGKNVNFLLTKFTSKAIQLYSQGLNFPPVKNP